MKSRSKSIRNLLAVAIVLLAFAAVAALWSIRSPQIITLANGDQYAFAGVTSGTNLVPPSPLYRFARLLPKPLANLEARAFGPEVTWVPPAYFSPHPQLIAWLKQIKTNLNTPLFTDIFVRISDASGVEAGVPAYEDIALRPGSYWTPVGLDSVPRRSRTLRLNFYSRNGAAFTNLGTVTLRNPLFGRYPQWQPTDSAPSTKMTGPVGVKLQDFSVSHLETDGTFALPGGWPAWPAYMLVSPGQHPRTLVAYAVFTILSPTNAAEEWSLVSTRISDATGNTSLLTPYGEHLVPTADSPDAPFAIFSDGATRPGWEARPVYPIQLSPGLFWPGENAWRLEFQFKRSKGFTTNEMLTFTNVPIPAFRATNFVPIIQSVGEIKIRIIRLIRDPLMAAGVTSALGPSVQIVLDLPDQPAGVVADIVDVNTPLGRPNPVTALSGSANGPIFNSLPANAGTMDITVAVQKPRTVEFYLKPPRAP